MNNSSKYYSLAAEVKRVSNNLKYLKELVSDYGLPKNPKHMIEEVAFLEQELEHLNEERSKRYNNNVAHQQLSYISA